MSVHHRYVPVLKAGVAELDALAKTTNHAFSQIIPVIELINWPPAILEDLQDYDPDKPPPAIERHVFEQLKRITDAMPQESRLFLDLHQLSRDILWRYPFLIRRIFTHLYLSGLGPIPVIHAGTHPVVAYVFKEIEAIVECGFMIRLNRLDLFRLHEIRRWLKCPLGKIDLLLDYGSIHDDNMDALVASAAGFINHHLPFVQDWRSLTLASGAFPASIRGYLPAIPRNFSRLDSRFWYRLIQQGLKRDPWFSDYGIVHPHLPVARGRYSSAAALPYATTDQWQLLWGEQKNNFDLRNSCKRLCSSAQYDGPEFSYADRQIHLFASGELDKLDATERKIIGYNRHFEQICSLLPN